MGPALTVQKVVDGLDGNPCLGVGVQNQGWVVPNGNFNLTVVGKGLVGATSKWLGTWQMPGRV